MFLQELVAFVYWSREIWKNILAANNQGNSLNDRCSDSQFVFYPTLCCVFLVYEQISNCLKNFMKFALQRLKCIRTSNTCSTIEMIIFMIMNMQFETVFQWIAYYSYITQLHSYTQLYSYLLNKRSSIGNSMPSVTFFSIENQSFPFQVLLVFIGILVKRCNIIISVSIALPNLLPQNVLGKILLHLLNLT